MSLPRPWLIVRYLSAAVTFGIAFFALAATYWQIATTGSYIFPAAPAHQLDASTLAKITIWCACSVLTGWGAMQDAADAGRD